MILLGLGMFHRAHPRLAQFNEYPGRDRAKEWAAVFPFHPQCHTGEVQVRKPTRGSSSKLVLEWTGVETQ